MIYKIYKNFNCSKTFNQIRPTPKKSQKIFRMSQTNDTQDNFNRHCEENEIEDIYTDRMFNEIVNQPRSSSPELMCINDTFDLLDMESQDTFEELYKLSLEDPACQLNESEDFNFLFEKQNSKPVEVIEVKENQSSNENP